jgi:predicted nucleotidyltransferase
LKTIGVIAEFNPFHRGHEYLIAEAKALAKADFCIVVMSGNFVQRGAPAVMDKYARTQMALLNGADLVLELPACYATGSAEYFARGAICLLDKLGIVDYVCFGSECGNIALLKQAAAIFTHESPAYQESLRENLKKGCSYPVARSLAIDSFSSPAAAVINQPNNILAIEYLRALSFFQSPVIPLTIKRKGAGYHDEQATANEYCSATAIRKMLFQAANDDDTLKLLKPFVPENTLSLYSQPPLCENDFSSLLHYKLLLEAGKGFRQYLDISEDLSDKIIKNLIYFESYSDFIRTLKSKDLTYMRLSRCLCHILLDIYDADVSFFCEQGYIFYARMLGFQEKAGGLLAEIKKRTTIPLLSKLADAGRLLSETGLKMLNKDIQAAHIYESIASVKHHKEMKNEFTSLIVKI